MVSNIAMAKSYIVIDRENYLVESLPYYQHTDMNILLPITR